MNLPKLVENISVAMVAQMVNMLVSIATVILAPKVMGVEQYGYWQLFIFYGTYVSLFHLGINDGVYLLNGGKGRDEIDKRQIASQFWFGIAYQLAMVAVAVPIIFFADTEANRTFVLLSLAVFLVVCNAASYIGYVFQAMNETKVYSQSVIVERGLLFAGLCILLAFGVGSFEPYVVTFIATKACALAYCLVRGRDFIFLRPESFFDTARNAWKSIKVGSQLLIAVNAGSLVMGVARFAIDANWSIETFGMVSFSLSIVNFIMAFVGQVSMVLFPALRQCSRDELRRYFVKGRDALAVILPAVLILYWPACVFVDVWLPDYREATYYMALLAPLCIFDGRMNILCTTYFKVLRMETVLLAVNLVTLVACTCGCLLAVALGMPVEAVLVVALLVVALRSITSEILVVRRIRAEAHSSVIRDVLPAIVFVVACHWLNGLASLAMYSVFLLVFFFFNRRVLADLVGRLKRS